MASNTDVVKKNYTVTCLSELRVKKSLKSVNIWQSYKQKRDCLVHFLRLLAVCWPSAQSAWDNRALACNFATKYSPMKKNSLTHSAINLFNFVINNPTTR